MSFDPLRRRAIHDHDAQPCRPGPPGDPRLCWVRREDVGDEDFFTQVRDAFRYGGLPKTWQSGHPWLYKTQ